MRCWRAGLLIALLGGAAAPAAAADDPAVRASVRTYAACVAQKATRGARAFVLSDSRNPPAADACLPSDVRGFAFAGDSQRYAIAEALLQRDYPGGIPGAVGQVAQADHGARPADATRVATWTLGVIGDCVARAAPADAFALAKSEDDSPEENAAIAALRPVVAGCIPAGSTVTFTRMALRGSIALYLYRLAAARGAG